MARKRQITKKELIEEAQDFDKMKLVRLELRGGDHLALRVAAAQQGLSMAAFARIAVMEAVREGLRHDYDDAERPVRTPTEKAGRSSN